MQMTLIGSKLTVGRVEDNQHQMITQMTLLRHAFWVATCLCIGSTCILVLMTHTFLRWRFSTNNRKQIWQKIKIIISFG